MIDSLDLTKEELETLKGDAVGNSAHSATWILKTLESLCKICQEDWTEDLENDLCLLWDMSVDEDVRVFLVRHDFFDIAKCVLTTHTEPRLIEIVLGIIGNIFCHLEAFNLVGADEELVVVILDYLKSEDTKILIQVLRLLHAIVYGIWSNKSDWNVSDWKTHLKKCDFLGDTITFILQSSTDEELLMEAVTFFKFIIDSKFSFLMDLFTMKTLIPALLESFVEVISEERSNSDKELKFIGNWLDILDNLLISELFISNNENDTNLLRLMEVIYRILKPYEMYPVFPIQERDISIIELSVNLIHVFHTARVNVSPKINHILASLAFNLKEDAEPEDIVINEKKMHDLSKFINYYWSKIAVFYTKKQVAEILHPLKSDVREYLINFLT